MIHAFMFLFGLEYAFIFPTVWEYLQSLGVQEDQTYWLRLCLAAVTVTCCQAGLVSSRVMEQRIQIFNTGLYSLAISQHVIMVSRIVSGLEKSIIIVYLTDTCRSTSIAERTPVHLVFNIPRQVNCNELKKEKDKFVFSCSKYRAQGD